MKPFKCKSNRVELKVTPYALWKVESDDYAVVWIDSRFVMELTRRQARRLGDWLLAYAEEKEATDGA